MPLLSDKIELTRECGDCTMCCEGFLPALIHDYEMKPGVPCHFVKTNTCKGCTIHEHRPALCDNYECLWKSSPFAVPEWMKPNKSDVILTVRTVNDDDDEEFEYIQMRQGHGPVRGDVLNWVLRLAFYGGVNLEYEVNGTWYFHGNTKWIRYMVGPTGPHGSIQVELNNCKHPSNKS